MVRVPGQGGVVYAFPPVNVLNRERSVHRTLLKPVLPQSSNDYEEYLQDLLDDASEASENEGLCGMLKPVQNPPVKPSFPVS